MVADSTADGRILLGILCVAFNSAGDVDSKLDFLYYAAVMDWVCLYDPVRVPSMD